MKEKFTAAASVAALVAGLSLAVPALAQTIFTTEDYRRDGALWTDPAYYRNNTIGELRSMAVDYHSYGSEGSGRIGALDLASLYPYASAWEHYQAWLAEADGGTQHTYETMPDWRGRWVGGAAAFDGGQNPVSSVAAMMTPQHQQYLVQAVKAASEGRDWWSGAFCFTGGFLTSVTDAEEFVVTPDKVWTLGAGNAGNYIRWIYTDGSGLTAEEFRYPKWHGESIGFWDDDDLIVYTNQIRGWDGGPSEFTDDLETVERYRRVGDAIEGEITLYDDNVFVRPYHSKLSYERDTDTRPELRPLFNSCSDTNGPSQKVFLDERGILNERLPGDPLYWDATDPRPWGTFFDLSDERYRAFLATGGNPHGE